MAITEKTDFTSDVDQLEKAVEQNVDISRADEIPLSAVVDKATERRLLSKLDKRIVPVIMWLYLMNVSLSSLPS